MSECIECKIHENCCGQSCGKCSTIQDFQQDGSPPERKPSALRPEEEGTEAGDMSRTAAPLGDPKSSASKATRERRLDDEFRTGTPCAPCPQGPWCGMKGQEHCGHRHFWLEAPCSKQSYPPLGLDRDFIERQTQEARIKHQRSDVTQTVTSSDWEAAVREALAEFGIRMCHDEDGWFWVKEQATLCAHGKQKDTCLGERVAEITEQAPAGQKDTQLVRKLESLLGLFTEHSRELADDEGAFFPHLVECARSYLTDNGGKGPREYSAEHLGCDIRWWQGDICQKCWQYVPLPDVTRPDLQQTQLKRYREALESISKNGCCDTCQEAKLVALKALEDQ